MNGPAFDYFIRSDLPANPETPSVLGEKFVATLDALTKIDPMIFANWEVMDFPAISSIPLDAARPRIASITENNVCRDDYKEPDLYRGYRSVAFTTNVVARRKMHVWIIAGGKLEGDTWLQAGDYKAPPDPEIVAFPLFKAALLAINAIWPASWACAQAFRMGYWEAPLFSGAPLFPYSRFHIPWLAYLSASLMVGFSVPPDVLTERTPDGGLLMTATEERLDPTNAEHLRRARILADILVARTGHAFSIPAP